MDIHQLKTFVCVAREGSITRASDRVHLSPPAVSAHIKAIEDALGLVLFERTARGMILTPEGERLLAKAEQILDAHHQLMDEATRIKGRPSGKLRLGAGSNSNHQAVGRLLTCLAERFPDVEVTLKHGTSLDIVSGIRDGVLDAGFYNEAGEPDAALSTVEVSTFGTYVVSPPGLVVVSQPLDWQALAELTWIYPASSACCGKIAESTFKTYRIRPKRIVSVDREDVTRTLVAGGLGVGLLHADTARAAQARGEVELVFESPTRTRVLFAHLTTRAHEPVLCAANALVGVGSGG